MILWLLSLFPQFRTLRDESKRLREALQSVSTDKLMLQDRLDAALEDRGRLWGMVESATSNERTAYQMQVNAQWQKQGFGAPYPDAPKLPGDAVQHGGGTAGNPRPEMPSTRVARATNDFIQRYQVGI